MLAELFRIEFYNVLGRTFGSDREIIPLLVPYTAEKISCRIEISRDGRGLVLWTRGNLAGGIKKRLFQITQGESPCYVRFGKEYLASATTGETWRGYNEIPFNDQSKGIREIYKFVWEQYTVDGRKERIQRENALRCALSGYVMLKNSV